MDLGEFTGCAEETCQLGEWTGRAAERGWSKEDGGFFCPAHKDGAYEKQTGHEITCLAGIGQPCDCELMPVGITVFCDRCGHATTGDYVVAEGMSKEQRLAVAREWLRRNAGWTYNDGTYTDLCRECTRGIAVKKSGDTVTITVEDYEFLDDSARVLEFGLEYERLVWLYEEIGRYLAKEDL